MKTYLSLLFLVSALFAQYDVRSESPIKVSAKDMSSNSSTITDINKYNTYDHANINLGILEYETVNTSLNIGYKRFGMHDANNKDSSYAINSISIPYIRVGTPNKIYFDAFYSINPVQSTQHDNTDNELESTVMPFSQFGLQLVGQVPDGSFKIGVGGNGYFGTETWNENSNHRSILGAENVGISIGFRLQEFVNLSFKAHTEGFIDSLYLPKNTHHYRREIFAYWKIPQLDLALDIGKDELPYLTNLLMTYSKSNFTYTMKGLSGSSMLTTNDYTVGYVKQNQGDAVVADSMAMNWKNIWIADADGAGIFKPALSIGFFHDWYEHMIPDGGDNIPFGPVLKGPQPGYEYETGSFNFGFGLNYSYKEIVEAWFEYGLATLSMDVKGENINFNNGGFVPDGHGYNRIGLGIKTNFEKWPIINLKDGYEISLLFGFMMRQENLLYGTYRDWPLHYMYDLNTVNNNGTPVEYDTRYRPWRIMANEVKTTNVTFGLSASFLDHLFETDLHIGILSQKMSSDYSASYIPPAATSKGLEFGVDLTYNLIKSKKVKSTTTKSLSPNSTTEPVNDISPKTE